MNIEILVVQEPGNRWATKRRCPPYDYFKIDNFDESPDIRMNLVFLSVYFAYPLYYLYRQQVGNKKTLPTLRLLMARTIEILVV
ncbi:MAG: hypothetical protein DRR19_29640 [Candidatus Parabeggiatoa sp. nov. 1]|nr:MAG: hypothetical protein DRR19_29640 [Gammaproteobacteria bacterium]